MKVTVILCTYNRCRSLEAALNSVAALALPQSVAWEVLVVDNNSSDQTRDVVEAVCRKNPGRFRYLFEPKRGKSYALNAGIREARGDVLAFLDDDVTVEPTWLQNLTAALQDPKSKWAGSGGRIVLQWPASLPSWLSIEGPRSRHIFPGFDQGREAKELVGPPFGTNMSFRKAMFEKYGGFRTDLGPSPRRDIPAPGEDTEFGRRLIAAGECLRYEPSAVVYHPVPENRIDKKRFLAWWFDNGRAEVRQFKFRPVRLCCSLAASTLRWLAAVEPRARFYRKLIVWQKTGQIAELYGQSQGTKTKKSQHGTP